MNHHWLLPIAFAVISANIWILIFNTLGMMSMGTRWDIGDVIFRWKKSTLILMYLAMWFFVFLLALWFFYEPTGG